MIFYFVEVDELGVECVDQLGPYVKEEEDVARLADRWPDVIYFGLEPE